LYEDLLKKTKSFMKYFLEQIFLFILYISESYFVNRL